MRDPQRRVGTPTNAITRCARPEKTLSSQTFTDLGVEESIVTALDRANISSPFPIQAMCIPLALEGQDLIGQAKTGTGKTLGFGVPLLQSIDADRITTRGRKPVALVVVPTRELCIQVTSDLEVAGRDKGICVLSVYGGRSYEPQIDQLASGVDVTVGTPGRLLDLARQGYLDLSSVETLVLDEADEMLDMGFLPDVESIVSQLPTTRQTMLFSATMPGQIVNLARRYMTNPTHIRASDPNDDAATVDAIEQHVWRAHAMDKPEVIARVLQADGRQRAIIFCKTKRAAQKLADDLTERGFKVAAIHGDLGQIAREKALDSFRADKCDVLVATDVAARGIDVDRVTHVINYSCPEDEKAYLHRIGRTGRAGAAGVAVTLVDWDDLPRWGLINTALGLPFNDPIETYSTSKHIYTGLGISPDVKGSLRPVSHAKPKRDDSGTGGGQKSRSRNRRAQSTEASKPDGASPAKRRRRRTRGGKPAAQQSSAKTDGQ